MAFDQNKIDEQVREYRRRVDQYIKELDEIAVRIEKQDTTGALTPELKALYIEFHQKKIAMMEESLRSYEAIRAYMTEDTDNADLLAQEAEMKAAIVSEKEELEKYL